MEFSPPFFEPDLREPVPDRLVDEVLLDAAAARFEPLFFADDLVPDFEPPRAEADFLAPERALDREADFEPLLRAPPFAEDFDALRVDFFAPLFLEEEAPLRADVLVPFLEPDEEPFEPPLLLVVEDVDPPEEPLVFV